MDTITPTSVVPVVGMMPARGSEDAAAFDLAYSPENEHAEAIGFILMPGERRLVPTGTKVALPAGTCGLVLPRSGLALSHGITLPNTPGTIDSDYRGEVKVALVNLGQQPFRVTRGMRIAQMVFARFEAPELDAVELLPATARGAGGFGSTGS